MELKEIFKRRVLGPEQIADQAGIMKEDDKTKDFIDNYKSASLSSILLKPEIANKLLVGSTGKMVRQHNQMVSTTVHLSILKKRLMYL